LTPLLARLPGLAAYIIMLALPLQAAETNKQIVGAVEQVTIVEAGITFDARIDTGATSCSIDAGDISIIAPSPNGVQRIAFVVSNRPGEQRLILTIVDSQVRIHNADGSSMRYKVPLTVRWHGHEKTVLFTLKSRKKMTYRVLLGRNWLHGDYIVDVNRNPSEASVGVPGAR